MHMTFFPHSVLVTGCLCVCVCVCDGDMEGGGVWGFLGVDQISYSFKQYKTLFCRAKFTSKPFSPFLLLLFLFQIVETGNCKRTFRQFARIACILAIFSCHS